MAIEVFNRYETKFLLNIKQYYNIQKEIKRYMKLDEYNLKKEFYTISNIYYDTDDNYLIRKSLSKPLYKEKVRLRAYGVPSHNEKVFLELKKKYNSVVNKRRTSILIEEAENFIETGEKPCINSYMNEQVINELEYALNLYHLKPKAYIAYDRKAFFAVDDPNLRLTIDKNIRTRRDDLSLEAGDYGKLLLPYNTYLMEIKSTGGIPIWLANALSENQIYKTSFSKYGEEYKRFLENNLYQYKEEKKYAWFFNRFRNRCR